MNKPRGVAHAARAATSVGVARLDLAFVYMVWAVHADVAFDRQRCEHVANEIHFRIVVFLEAVCLDKWIETDNVDLESVDLFAQLFAEIADDYLSAFACKRKLRMLFWRPHDQPTFDLVAIDLVMLDHRSYAALDLVAIVFKTY